MGYSPQKDLAIRMRNARHEAGLSQAALAELLGWTQSKVAKIERCVTRPSYVDVVTITSTLSMLASDAEGMLSLARVVWDHNPEQKPAAEMGIDAAIEEDRTLTEAERRFLLAAVEVVRAAQALRT